jgi:hypothetical protein
MIFRTGKRAKGPAHDLEAFKAELRLDNFRVYRTRALDVVQRLRRCGKPAAREFIRQAALSLEAADYAHTLRHPNGQEQDVYGKLIREEGWYLKIEISLVDGEPGIISCHPAEHDLDTRGGTVPRTWRKRF